MRSIDVSEFRKVNESFAIALNVSKDDLVRDAAIQRFEFCTELAWKWEKGHGQYIGFS